MTQNKVNSMCKNLQVLQLTVLQNLNGLKMVQNFSQSVKRKIEKVVDEYTGYFNEQLNFSVKKKNNDKRPRYLFTGDSYLIVNVEVKRFSPGATSAAPER